MNQPTDPLARQLALTALTTEHFNLQTIRMGTIAEANGRSPCPLLRDHLSLLLRGA